jgi:hypothetical protein
MIARSVAHVHDPCVRWLRPPAARPTLPAAARKVRPGALCLVPSRQLGRVLQINRSSPDVPAFCLIDFGRRTEWLLRSQLHAIAYPATQAERTGGSLRFVVAPDGALLHIIGLNYRGITAAATPSPRPGDRIVLVRFHEALMLTATGRRWAAHDFAGCQRAIRNLLGNRAAESAGGPCRI